MWWLKLPGLWCCWLHPWSSSPPFQEDWETLGTGMIYMSVAYSWMCWSGGSMYGSPCTLLKSTQSVCMKYNNSIITVVTYSVLLAPISPWVNPLYNGCLYWQNSLLSHQISKSIQRKSVSEQVRIGIVFLNVFLIRQPDDVTFQFLLLQKGVIIHSSFLPPHLH